MRLRYGLYILGLFLTFLFALEMKRFGEMREDLLSRQRELLKARGEILKKVQNVDRLKEFVLKEGLPTLSKEEALRVLMGEVERLRSEFGDLKVRRDVRADENIWRVDVEVSFRPKSAEELKEKIGKLMGKVKPVIHISRLSVNQREEGTEVVLLLEIYQPFLGVKR